MIALYIAQPFSWWYLLIWAAFVLIMYFYINYKYIRPIQKNNKNIDDLLMPILKGELKDLEKIRGMWIEKFKR